MSPKGCGQVWVLFKEQVRLIHTPKHFGKVIVSESRFFHQGVSQHLKHHNFLKKQRKNDLSTDQSALYYYD